MTCRRSVERTRLRFAPVAAARIARNRIVEPRLAGRPAGRARSAFRRCRRHSTPNRKTMMTRVDSAAVAAPASCPTGLTVIATLLLARLAADFAGRRRRPGILLVVVARMGITAALSRTILIQIELAMEVVAAVRISAAAWVPRYAPASSTRWPTAATGHGDAATPTPAATPAHTHKSARPTLAASGAASAQPRAWCPPIRSDITPADSGLRQTPLR